MRSSGAPVSVAAGSPRRFAPRRPLNANVRQRKPAMTRDLSAELGQAILDHLAQHPNAADTLEGICQWWLPDRLRCSEAQVERVLKELERNSQVSLRHLPSGVCIYAA